MPVPRNGDGPLSGCRVVELGEHVSAPYAGRLLAELGADVVKVEPPEGDRARRHGPFAGAPDPERSGLFHALNFDKRGIVLDLDAAADRRRLDALLDGADALVTNLPLARRRALALDGPSLARRHPRLVATAVTAYGDCGPYAERAGSALTSAALAGASWVVGRPDRAPLAPPHDLPDYLGGANAAAATLAALLGRERGAAGGQAVDVSTAELLASFVGTNARMYVPFGKPWRRAGRSASESGGAYPYAIFPCADGHVALIGRGSADWRKIVAAMGDPAWARAERFADPFEIARHHAEEADRHVAAWTASRSRAELLAIAREHGFALGPLLSADELLAHEHLAHRGTFSAPLPVGDDALRVPLAPLRSSLRPVRRERRPAPRLGEHGRELMREAARGASCAASSPAPAARDGAAGAPGGPGAPGAAGGLLRGLRVLDLSWVWSGPMVAAALADLGAEVIKVEHRGRLDNSRLRGRPVVGACLDGPPEEISPYVHQVNRGKLSVTADMKHPDGARLLRDLAARCDVVIENLSPGVLDRNGLGWEQLSRRDERLVMLSMSTIGRDGPLSGMRGYAPVMTSFAGLEQLVGYPDDPAVGMMTLALGDPTSGSHALVALLAALLERERSGRGQHLDFSQTEALVALMAEPLAERQLTGRDPAARGMAHPSMAPHGHFPCRGEDRWIAIAVAEDAEWQALAAALGARELARDERFATHAGRVRDRAALDAAVGARTAERDRDELFGALAAAGVDAAPVLDLDESQRDPNARARGLFVEREHPICGPGELMRLPWRLQRTPVEVAASGPTIGQHTREVCRRLLGLDDAEIDRHEASGALR